MLALVVLHASAWAQSLEQKPPTFRASLTGGAAWRTSDRRQGAVGLHYDGIAPPVVRFAGAVFFLPWLGFALDASYETFVVAGLLDGSRKEQRLHGGRLLGELAARWSPKSSIGLELHLGYGGGWWPMMGLDGVEVIGRAVGWHGPTISFLIGFEPEGPVGGQLFGRFAQALGGNQAGVTPFNASAGFQLFFGNLAVGDLRGAVVLESEVIGVRGGDDTSGLENNFNQLAVRFGLGLRLRHQPPAPSVVAPPDGTTGRIRGRVLFAGVGVANASVTVGTLPLIKSGPGGDFELERVQPGKYTVAATAEGYRPAEQSVEVRAGEEAVVSLELRRPTGPGRIKGVVKGEKDAPLAGAEVSLEGKPPVKTAADGSYTLEGAGPGVTKVVVKAKGYKDGDDAAQVPPEGIATLDLTLVKLGEKPLATIRGSVQAASGRKVKATVRVSDVNLTIPIKGDGRFVVQVPGGKYTLTIEAAGYVTQVKTVEVADGDQAIFHCDLQPAGR